MELVINYIQVDSTLNQNWLILTVNVALKMNLIVFYNRGEDNLYYLVNWEQYTNGSKYI